MTRVAISPARLARVLAPILFGLLLVLVLGGCALFGPKPVDPLANYRPALGPNFTLAPVTVDALPAYSITVQVNPGAMVYTGTVEVSFPVSSTASTRELYFRLYPNLKQFGGRVQVASASVNGFAVNYAYAADNTAVHLVLAQPLPVGKRAVARLSYSGQPPDRATGAYTLVGRGEDILSLMGFYPMLAVRRTQDWALDLADPLGDSGFQDAALFEADVTAPADQIIAATGTETSRTPQPGGWVTTHYVQGPAREFAVLLSPRFQILEEEAYGTRVRSYFLPEDAEAGKSALYDAVAAMEIFSDQFGPYPYREMAVVEAPLTFRGQEFPGMNLIGSQAYSQYQTDLEMRVAHEVGHQWWYNQVGSDQTLSPWLDEGLTEFSMYYYFAKRYGEGFGDRLRQRRWEAPVNAAKVNGTDAPIGRPVDFYNERNYETIIYAKSALFVASLRDEIGPQAFDQMLRTYLDTYRWQIASPEEFRALAERTAGRDLGQTFMRWLEGVAG